MLVQVSLLLKIALLNFSFSAIVEKSQVEWKFSRSELIRDSAARSAIPPPFNLVFIIIWPAKVLRILCCGSKRRRVADGSTVRDWRSTQDIWAK